MGVVSRTTHWGGKTSREKEERNTEERWCWLHLPELEKVLVEDGFRALWRPGGVLREAALPRRLEEEGEEEEAAAEDLRRDTKERIKVVIWKESSDLQAGFFRRSREDAASGTA